MSAESDGITVGVKFDYFLRISFSASLPAAFVCALRFSLRLWSLFAYTGRYCLFLNGMRPDAVPYPAYRMFSDKGNKIRHTKTQKSGQM